MTTNINYQQIYEDELSETIKSSLELPRGFYELSHQNRMLIEELIDTGYQRAIEDALDPEVLEETASLTVEMAGQLNGFASLLRSYLNNPEEDA
tara:strand:- start:514 stop:795 length:282 start_codon:yes stop_codon:yes gene_type:complete